MSSSPMPPNIEVAAPALPSLPVDLYRPILESIQPRRHTQTLLTLSLVNRAWRCEIQSLFFRYMDFRASSYRREDEDRAIEKHISFLEAIVANPVLGSYVRGYAQLRLMYNGREVHRFEHYTKAFRLWNLTCEALPLMVNLKHLALSRHGHTDPYPCTWLNACTFQLESLWWGIQDKPSDDLISFLNRQTGLRHLEVGMYRDEQRLFWLPESSCRTLESTGGVFHSLATVARSGRKITAFRGDNRGVRPAEGDQEDLSAVQHLRYLSLWQYETYHSFVRGTAMNNIVLLEVQLNRCHSYRRGELFALFPSLRLVSMGGVSSIDMGHSNDWNDSVVRAFQICQSLLYILVRDRDVQGHEGDKPFMQFWVDDALDDDSGNRGVQSRELQLNLMPSKPWWALYEPLLNAKV